MNTILRSPWLAVALGILGIVAGYMLVVAQHTTVTSAAEPVVGTCPNKELCKNQGCGCANNTCKGDCPGTCPGKKA